MKKEFTIIALHALPYESILVTLVPVFKASGSSEDHTPNPARVIVGPSIQSEAEKMMQEMMKGVFDEIERRYGPPQSGTRPSLPLALTKEEYADLGSPLVNSLISLSIEKIGEGEDQ